MSGSVAGINPAVAAYSRTAARLAPADAAGTPLPTFGQVLQQTATDAIAAGRRGEAAALEAVTGRASIHDVVEAVTAAELTLQSVVAVRDRVIAAYQDIMRMPI
jgi:flagellar hook-basal body complex protein FliE